MPLRVHSSTSRNFSGLAASRLEVHEQHTASRRRYRRAFDVGGLERALRRADGVLPEPHRNHDGGGPRGRRQEEAALRGEDRDDEADGGDDDDRDPDRPLRVRARERHPRRAHEHEEQDELRDDPQEFLGAQRDRGGDHTDDQQNATTAASR